MLSWFFSSRLKTVVDSPASKLWFNSLHFWFLVCACCYYIGMIIRKVYLSLLQAYKMVQQICTGLWQAYNFIPFPQAGLLQACYSLLFKPVTSRLIKYYIEWLRICKFARLKFSLPYYIQEKECPKKKVYTLLCVILESAQISQVWSYIVTTLPWPGLVQFEFTTHLQYHTNLRCNRQYHQTESHTWKGWFTDSSSVSLSCKESTRFVRMHYC